MEISQDRCSDWSFGFWIWNYIPREWIFLEFEFRAFTLCAEALTFGGLGFFFGRLSLWGLVAASCSTSCSWHIG